METKNIKDLILAIPTGGSLCMIAVENYFQSTAWWAQIPWVDILLVFSLIWAGRLWEAAWNEDSDLRKRWGNINSKFVVVSTNVGGGMEPRRLEAKARIKFTKRISKGKLILRVYSCVGLNRKPHVSVIHLEDVADAVKDQTRDIVLATKAIAYPGWKPFHSSFGPFSGQSSIVSFVGSSKNILELELKSGFFSQKTKFFIQDISYGSSEYGGGVYAANEDQKIWDLHDNP